MTADLSFSAHVVVARPPQQVYDLVSDVTRTGEWSPTCVTCWWDEGAGPEPGSWFTGRNVTPSRTWETRSQVLVARPGEEFTWVVGDGLVRWSYLLEPHDGGTLLTETWQFLPAGLEFFRQKYGEDADAQIEDRRRAAHEGIPRTLAAVRAVAEAEG